MKKSPFAFAVLLACTAVGGPGCGVFDSATTEPEDDSVEGEGDLNADASFKLETAADCVASFDAKPFMGVVASRRGWDKNDIQSFCAQLETIKKAYVNDVTFTTVTIAGSGKIQGDTLKASYYIGATGYNLTEIRRFLGGVVGNGVVRRCMRKAAARRLVPPRSLPAGFVVDCLEEESGLDFPKPLFRARLSNVTLGDLGEVGAGAGINLTMISVPGVGVVVGVLGGAFYAQKSPAYGAFLGCGTLLGVTAAGTAAQASPICLGAEFADVSEGTAPRP